MPPTPTAKTTKATTEFTCPECGRTFTRAASLGAHRHQSHKVPGATNQSSTSTATATPARKPSKRRRARHTARTAAASATPPGANRDALLQTLFPNGIPPKESVIRSVNAWLDEAERLTRLR
jgi:hypothetical protein